MAPALQMAAKPQVVSVATVALRVEEGLEAAAAAAWVASAD